MIKPAKNIETGPLMKIGNLELRAKLVVEGFFSGLHRSPYHGFSVEFTEYRQYVPGDDPRYLDWNLYARSDRYYIRKFEDETNLRCFFVVDQSSSMAYGSIGYRKCDYAVTLASSLALMLHRQGDGIGLLSFAESVIDFMPAKHRKSHLRQFFHSLERAPQGKSTDIASPLEELQPLIKRRGMVVMISDFLTDLSTLEKQIQPLRAAGHEILLFQILDPAEVDFNFGDSAQFDDLESGQLMYIDPAKARKTYLQKLATHQANLHSICVRLGVGLHKVTSTDSLDLALLAFLSERQSRSRQNQRVNVGGAR